MRDVHLQQPNVLLVELVLLKSERKNSVDSKSVGSCEFTKNKPPKRYPKNPFKNKITI